MTYYDDSNRFNLQASVEGLCRVAQLANVLARQLTGRNRALAYRIKAEICSSLILEGSAKVNGLWATGIVALDLGGNPRFRLHIPASHLSRQARRAVQNQGSRVLVVSRLGEQLGQKLSASTAVTPASAPSSEEADATPTDSAETGAPKGLEAISGGTKRSIQ